MRLFLYIFFISQLLNFLDVFAQKVIKDSSQINSVKWEKVEEKSKPLKKIIWRSYNNDESYFENEILENITLKSSYILVIRSFPILPHILGSYIIASSKIKKMVILKNTFLGSFFYYIFLFAIIRTV